MGDFMRSEKMAKCVFYLESDVAYDSMSHLGELGVIQFLDMNKDVLAHSRKYTSELKRLDEMERKLRYFKKLLMEEKLTLSDEYINPVAPPVSKMAEMESCFESMEQRLTKVSDNLSVLVGDKSRLIELKHVLKNLNIVFQENLPERNHQQDHETGKVGFTAGVMPLEKVMRMERLLWFACRGNALVKNVDILEPVEDPVSKAMVNKTVVYIFYQGEQLKSRVDKILEGFHANVYSCPEAVPIAEEEFLIATKKIADLETVIAETHLYRARQLAEISTRLPEWQVQVRKMKAIFHTLNMFSVDIGRRYLIGDCWCPESDMERVKKSFSTVLEGLGYDSSAAVLNRIGHASETPPTFNRTNKFTKVFQSIVNSYGIPTYREVNPAPFLIITFPFLFSLMFGDAGHGLLVFLIALWMVLIEKQFMNKKIDNEIWKIFFGGRYIILLMGAFSIYSGLIYNDVFSRPINIFGSAWWSDPRTYDTHFLHNNKEVSLNPLPVHNISDYRTYPFPFGMDPIWVIARNKITWSNSFKMKTSIIFGVCQMFFGVILSFFNHRYFKDPLSVLCGFLPEMLFLMCMFGYLVLLIFYKWIAFDASLAGCAPSLLINLISTFLYNYDPKPCSPTNFYPKQQDFQTALLLIVALCIPWLLLPKPLILRAIHNKKQKALRRADTSSGLEMANAAYDHNDAASTHSSVSSNNNNNNDDDKNVDKIKKEDSKSHGGHGNHEGHGGHGKEFDFGDAFIHQAIHTIEYCLGCISHTASYLRLWALSLAHAELSEVLWNMVLHNGFTLGASSVGSAPSIACIVLFVIFTPWAALTVAILLLMEGLSAFLHTLRLHWVEFQSKFYKGEGYKFEPFSFQKMLKRDDD